MSGTLLTKRPDIYDDACYTRHNQQYAPKDVCMSACARLRNYSHEECRGGMVVKNGGVVWSRGTVFREEAGETRRRRVDGG